MFLGHYGLALGVKKAAPQISLLTLFVAVEFVDILWPFLLLFNVEQVKVTPGITVVTPFDFVHYPYTHSLLMGIVWGLLAAVVYWFFKKDAKSAVIVGLAVLSHWFLDLVVHIADLPLTPFTNVKVGMGLWNSLEGTVILELIIFAIGAYLYYKNTKAIGNKGKWGFWLLIAFFLLIDSYNMFGPPPENSIPMLFVSFAVLQLIVLSLAHFVDKNRASL
ncbi:hypothetical protein MUK70_07575 [Dyadobacter chenwenxiniae]|uniref:Uncharacterized protein n=1 Tax=Dyadobacter chenwenxiniae TaxID=2906456 RepID=A0A9X1PKX7_9BACT|nr:metal-dependent hydrolase [Dyadobacter chenwenxiniae]MCF0062985.1 hypothetical protein [Dyadobacter chenwenxiniae]UON84841.1 hypothetical protein MUK70_07575 [Dyadobacter chenwenxiniae]